MDSTPFSAYQTLGPLSKGIKHPLQQDKEAQLPAHRPPNVAPLPREGLTESLKSPASAYIPHLYTATHTLEEPGIKHPAIPPPGRERWKIFPGPSPLPSPACPRFGHTTREIIIARDCCRRVEGGGRNCSALSLSGRKCFFNCCQRRLLGYVLLIAIEMKEKKKQRSSFLLAQLLSRHGRPPTPFPPHPPRPQASGSLSLPCSIC